jgi:hypothetical protein
MEQFHGRADLADTYARATRAILKRDKAAAHAILDPLMDMVAADLQRSARIG